MHKGDQRALTRKEQEAKAAREAGFSNYFSGANQDRAAQKDKQLRERTKSRKIVKQSESGEKTGWHDRAGQHNESARQLQPRASTDRYSQLSEDEDFEPHNKVG